MPRVSFTQNLQRHVPCESIDVPGGTVAEVLDHVFSQIPLLRGYVVADDGSLRPHMNVFVNQTQIQDRSRLLDAVAPNDELYIMQALSGG